MATLTGSSAPVSLGEGYAIRTPGFRGAADLKSPRPADVRSRGRVDDDGTDALERALAATDMTEVRQIDVRVAPTAGRPVAAGTLRGPDGQEGLELQVPDLGPETGQIVLACDEAGAISWHLPLDEEMRPQPPTVRGTGRVKRFVIPAEPRPPIDPSGAAKRSLLGVVGRKLLKVLVYPVTDPIIGTIGDLFAARWEGKHRPYGLRDFSPTNFRDQAGPALTSEDWRRLASGPALLFIHGTFSTAHGAFALMPDDTFRALHEHYGGRVFAFNHFTLSDDPARNVQWLLANLPAGLPLKADVICHSRGGLVARTIAEGQTSGSSLALSRVVFVGVPNQGTLLAEPDHMVKMIDRLTTAINLLPTGFVAETLEALITAVKMIGHGALKGLDGLRSMQPGGTFLSALNAPTTVTPQYLGIAADYEPADNGLKALVRQSVVDGVVDAIFEKAANDLVVPEAGVYSANGGTLFPLDEARLLPIAPGAGVSHVTFFAHPETNRQLQAWLTH